MTSYQKLKNRVKELESKCSSLENDIYILLTRKEGEDLKEVIHRGMHIVIKKDLDKVMFYGDANPITQFEYEYDKPIFIKSGELIEKGISFSYIKESIKKLWKRETKN